MMDIVEVSINSSNFPLNPAYLNHPEQHCNPSKSNISTRCIFENRSNYTKDSSLSSSCSKSYKTNTSKCTSVNTADRSHKSNHSSSNTVHSPDPPNHRVSSKHDEKKDQSLQTTASSSGSIADKEAQLKVTNSMSLDLTGSTPVSQPQINICPILRSDPVVQFSSTKWQLQCDQNKLVKSDIIMTCMDNYPTQSLNPTDSIVCLLKTSLSRSIQTIPVLILPVSNEDKMVETDEVIINSATVTGINEESQSKFSEECEKPLAIETFEKQTQAPQRYLSRITGNQKSIETSLKTETKVSGTKTAQKGVWGDVYNDYKLLKSTKLGKERSRFKSVQRAFSAKVKKMNSKPAKEDMSQTGDDISKPVIDTTENDQYVDVSSIPLSSEASKPVPDSRGFNFGYRSPDEIEFLTFKNYQRLFQVQPFDELVKSYLTISDRRVRAVCSKMQCKIQMYGPTMRLPMDLKYQTQSNPREKTIYHLVISTSSKERLDKSIKCIQETFPKACLNERSTIQNNLEIYGDEIPL